MIFGLMTAVIPLMIVNTHECTYSLIEIEMKTFYHCCSWSTTRSPSTSPRSLTVFPDGNNYTHTPHTSQPHTFASSDPVFLHCRRLVAQAGRQVAELRSKCGFFRFRPTPRSTRQLNKRPKPKPKPQTKASQRMSASEQVQANSRPSASASASATSSPHQTSPSPNTVFCAHRRRTR